MNHHIFLLENLYYVSQTIILIVAVFAAAFAAWPSHFVRRQYKFIAMFELTIFLQSEKMRKDRHLAMRFLEQRNIFKHENGEDNWSTEDRLAVSNALSAFDVVGMLSSESLVSLNFFAQFYEDAIVRLYEGHRDFIFHLKAQRVETYWGFFTLLYNRAKKFKTGELRRNVYYPRLSRKK